MSKDKIEQKVILSDNAQFTGNIIGKVVNIIKNPAQWQDTFFNFLSAHRYYFIIAIILQTGLLALYWVYKDLYLIPGWIWALTAVLLFTASWSGYTYVRYSRTPIRLSLTIAGILGTGSIIGWQTWQIANPTTFAPQVFGIAVAEIDEGTLFNLTNQRSSISDQIYERLCLDVKRNFSSSLGEDPCAIIPNPDDDTRRIVVHRIGVISDSQTAHDYGDNIGAEIVIWGQILGPSNGNVTIRFEILETLDQAVDPDVPVVMPVTVTSTEIFTHAGERDLVNDEIRVKEIVAQQSIIISSFTLGLAAYLDQDYPQAVQQLERAMRVIEQNPELQSTNAGMSLLYYYLGKSNHVLGRIDTGQQWLTLAQSSNPKEPAIPLSLALGYGSLGNPEAREENLQLALNLLNDWLKIHLDDDNALYDRGLIQQIRRQYANAALDFETVLAKNPSFFISYLQLSAVTLEMGQSDKAINWLETAINLAEESGTNASWAYVQLGSTYQQIGQAGQAKEAYQRAIQLSPKIDRMYFFYARFLEFQQEMDAALIAYQKMIDVSYSKGWAYEQLAHFYKRRGLLRDALLNYQQAINTGGDDPLLYTYLAEIYFDLGEQEQASQAFAKAITLNEETGIYYVFAQYAKMLFQIGDYPQAAEMYEESLLLRPIDYPVLINLAVTYEAMGDFSKAYETYNRVLMLDEHFSGEQIQVARDRQAVLDLTAP